MKVGMGMTPIAEACGVRVYCPRGGWFSFFNSPYPAHRSMTGVDVYPALEFGDRAPSPIGGRLTAFRRVRAPRGRLFKDVGYDVITLLESLENPGMVVKMLHVEPTIRPGEVVEVGEELGILLRSGYFDFWTSPHIHLEVREPSDPLRARGGRRFRRLLQPRMGDPPEELRGWVTLLKLEYALLTLEGSSGGLTGRVGDAAVLLDGGVPHYGWLGLHLPRSMTGGLVELCGQPIAMVEERYGECALARCTGPRFEVEGQRVGLSLYLSTEEASLKLVPPKPGALRLEEGEEITIGIIPGGGGIDRFR